MHGRFEVSKPGLRAARTGRVEELTNAAIYLSGARLRDIQVSRAGCRSALLLPGCGSSLGPSSRPERPTIFGIMVNSCPREML